MSADVAVIIPTLRRPESLERAVRSALTQTGVADRLRQIVVVDNDPQASSRAMCSCNGAWPAKSPSTPQV